MKLYTFSSSSLESHGFRPKKKAPTHKHFPQTELVLCCAEIISERAALSHREHFCSFYTSLDSCSVFVLDCDKVAGTL